jgi:uncharacterized membrane protein
MEVLLLVAIAGALVWMWTRMKVLERRVADLEAAADAAKSSPHPASSARSENEPWKAAPQEPVQETAAPPPAAPSPSSLQPLAATVAPEAARAEPPEEAQARPITRFSPSFDFEEIFGRLLPIWGGGIALAIAGFFLVRWSIEVGVLTQSVRVAMGFAFGAALVGAAEIAFRLEDRVGDARVRQALAGAGLATLYASVYLAGSQYGLIGSGLAFAALAGVTALAIALSFRFGLPSAVLGLVGGFAAPALAGSTDPNLPLLATYLALVTGGLVATGQRQQHPWLGMAALCGGLGWGALLLVAGSLDAGAILALGFYLVLVGTLLPSMMGSGPLGRIGRIAAAGLATVQIAALVDRSGYSLLAWGCYLLLGTAIAILGMRFARLREAGAVAAALAVCLLAVWSDAPEGWFALIAGAGALVFAAAPLLHVWRADAGPVDWGQLALFPIGLIAASCVQLDLPVLEGRNFVVALAALALAALPALGTWWTWPERGHPILPSTFAALTATFILAMLAGLLALPSSSAPLVTAALALPAAVLLRGRTGGPAVGGAGGPATGMVRALPWGIALSGLVLLLVTIHSPEVDRLFGEGAAPRWLAALRWLAAALPFGLLLADEANQRGRRLGEIAAAFLSYGALAMLWPGEWLPLAIGVAVLGLAWRRPQHGAALVTLLVLGTFWAARPLFEWVTAGMAALAGEPFLLGDLPSPPDTMRYVAPLATALASAMLLGAQGLLRHRRSASIVAVCLLAMVAHVAFKQVFALTDLERFVQLGLAERTIWQGLLALAAFGLGHLSQKLPGAASAGRIVAVVALVHSALFSLLLHNPLCAEQAVGNWPIANLLLPSYGLAIGLTLWLRAGLAGAGGRQRAMFDTAVMVLIALLALSELRQLYSGSLLLGPVSAQEDLMRSILAIAVALGFLAWGARRGLRSWRIGSLVLMLLAVFKVFIFDAAGLEGLARIASFFALGVCLIGIGWFYSKQLVARPAAQGSDGR